MQYADIFKVCSVSLSNSSHAISSCLLSSHRMTPLFIFCRVSSSVCRAQSNIILARKLHRNPTSAHQCKFCVPCGPGKVCARTVLHKYLRTCGSPFRQNLLICSLHSVLALALPICSKLQLFCAQYCRLHSVVTMRFASALPALFLWALTMAAPHNTERGVNRLNMLLGRVRTNPYSMHSPANLH